MTSTLSGLVPILATPFHADGQLDISSLRRLAEFQVGAGADGVAVFGMASEGFALTADERVTIMTEVRRAVGPEYPVVVGISSTSTATAIEQVRAVEDLGADLLMVLPPYLVKPAGQQLVDFYGTLAAATHVPVMIQDASAVTGVPMAEQLIAELAALDGITSVKVESQPTVPRIARLANSTGGDLAVFGGNNALFVLDEYASGSIGTMPACEFTDLLAAVLAAAEAGDIERSRVSFAELLPLINFGMQPGLAWAVHKEVLVRRGLIDTAMVRAPARDLDPATLDLLKTLLARLPITTI